MRGWSALRAAARIARRDARRARGRTALVAVLVGLPAFAGTAGGVLIQSSTPSDATYARFVLGPAGDTDQVIQARVGPYLSTDLSQSVRGDSYGWGDTTDPVPTVAEHERVLAGLLDDGARLLRAVRTGTTFATSERVSNHAVVLALPTDGDLSTAFPLDDGALPTAADEVALDPKLIERLAVLPGDTVLMDTGDGPQALRLTGTLAPVPQAPNAVVGPGGIPEPASADGAGSEVEAPPVTVEWYVVGPEPVTWPDLLAVNAIGSVVTSRAVLLDPPALHEIPGYHDSEGSGPAAGTIALVSAVAAVLLLEAVLLIGPAFAVGARRNERQLALLGAVGAERRTLRDVVLLTGVVTGLAAAVGGAVLGLATALGVRAAVGLAGHPFAFPDLRVPWLVVAGLAAFGTVAATLAAWLPARRAARIDVVAALAGRRPPVRHGRRLAVVGAVLAGIGGVAAAVGAVTTQPVLLAGGVIALELGVVAAAGSLIGLVARLAPRLGTISRIAVRDASRNRSRTAPAVAAVLAGVAGITAGAVYLHSDNTYYADQYLPFAVTGTVAIDVPRARSMEPGELADLLAAVSAAATEHLPTTAVHQVDMAEPVEVPEGTHIWLAITRPPENECPLWVDDRFAFDPEVQPTDAEIAEIVDLNRDPRCQGIGGWSQGIWTTDFGSATFVDDGAVIGALGFPESPRAAQALADGHVVISSEFDLWADRTVQLVPHQYEPSTDNDVAGPEVTLPAEAVALPSYDYSLVLPPEALEPLNMRAQPVGLVVAVSRLPTPAEEGALTAAAGADVRVYVERGNPHDASMQLWLLVAAAVVVGLAATGISVALAAAESRPDMATLAAVGAAPRARRRFQAAQAGVISGLGTTLGVLAGLALGWVLVTAERYRWAMPDFDRVLAVPWPIVAAIAVGVPLLAVTTGYLATRSRLPVVRRLAT